MSPIPDDFEQLRRLLALKRHEQPPPGFFNGFSRQVIVRIQVGELGNQSEASLWSFGGGSLLQRIWATLDARPVLAGAFGVAVCGFFVVGALLSDNTGTATAATGEPNTAVLTPRVPAPFWEPKTDAALSSTVGSGYQPPANSIFEEIKRLQTSPQSASQSRLATPLQVSFPGP
jgi:hypothetical protein